MPGSNPRPSRGLSRLKPVAMAVLPIMVLGLGLAGYRQLSAPAALAPAAGAQSDDRQVGPRNKAQRHRARHRGPRGPRYGHGNASWNTPQQRAIPVVKTLTVRLEDYAPTFSFLGNLVATRQTDLHMPVSGRLVEVSTALREGEQIRKGQLLARVDDIDYRTALEEARAAVEEAHAWLDEARAQLDQEKGALENAREQLALAESDLDRVRKLASSGTASAKALEDARLTVAQRRLALLQKRSALRMARARIAQLQAQLKSRELALARARRELAATRLLAPFDGRVLAATVAAGQYITPSTKLATVITDADLEVRFSISEDRYGDLLAGRSGIIGLPVRIGWKSGQARVELRGHVARLAPRLDDESGAVIAFATLDDPASAAALRIGSLVDVVLKAPPLKGVARLPEGALHDGGVIYRVEKGRLTPLKVRPLLWEKGQVVVSGPLQPGMRVLASHLPNVRPGMQVKVATP